MNPHTQLAVFTIPALIVVSAIKIESWDDKRDAEVAAQEASIVSSLEVLGVEGPHKTDGRDKYRGDVGNCNTTIWAQGDEAQFRVANGHSWYGPPNMSLIAVVDLDGELTIDEIEGFDEAGCFDKREFN